MITMYSNRDDRGMSPLENQMYNIGGYSNPYANNPYTNQYSQQQPMYQYQQPQQQYQSLGGMGSYYGGSNYYNPYLERIRQEEEKIAYESAFNRQKSSDIQLLRMSLSQRYGRPVDYFEAEKYYNKLMTPPPVTEESEDRINLADYQNTVNNPGVELVDEERNNIVHSYNELVNEYKDVSGMLDYFDKVSDNLRQNTKRELNLSQRNISGNYYDSNDFTSLLDLHNNNAFEYTDGYGVRRSVDISDQVISLPTNISSDFEERKRLFISKLHEANQNQRR